MTNFRTLAKVRPEVWADVNPINLFWRYLVSRFDRKQSNWSGFVWPITSAGAFLLPFLLIGCSEQTSQKVSTLSNQQKSLPSAETSSSAQAPKFEYGQSLNAEQNKIAQPAAGFLTAIIQGQQNEAKRWLTPTALKQVEENQRLLNPLGFQVDKLELGRVVSISSDDAAVEFLILEAGGTNQEEVCCLMKRNQSTWGVSGIACQAGPGESPSVISFEHGQSKKVSRPAGRKRMAKPSMDQFVDDSAESEEFRTANEKLPNVR